jgi:nitrous oxide reductase accessory protein NosL
MPVVRGPSLGWRLIHPEEYPMKRLFLVALATLALAGVARAQTANDDVKAAPACKHCGMDREKFAPSRMLVVYDDGTKVGLCSLHCAAVELAVVIDKSPATIFVADQGTKALVEAEKATWVVGGSLPGVMTKRAKWAFAERAAAEAFVKANGGALATFEEAVAAAYADMYQDSKMIREKRKAMRGKGAAAQPGAGGCDCCRKKS